MKTKRKYKVPTAIRPHAVAIQPLKISIKPASLTAQFGNLMHELPKLEIERPKNVLIPVLGGDPAAELPGAAPEPVYDARARANIQGNTIPGFNKDHQHFLFFRLGRLRGAKSFLRWIAPRVTSMEEVIAFVRAHRALRLRLGFEPPMCAAWLNIAFSADAVARLASPADAAAFGDESFRQGLAARSTYLGDPTSPRHAGHRGKWCVGGPKNAADILVIAAADDAEDLANHVATVKQHAADSKLRLLFEQRGDTLPGSLRGHEHFGFKDGVSQPGVRGKVSMAPGDYITPRYIDHADPRAPFFAKPGQLLIWPGEFLLGEPRQQTEHLYNSAPGATNFPRWAALGSYLVCRRLRQDVPAFWKFGMSPQKFASMLVGRWPSGAPIMRTPAADNAALAGDEWANNHFIFADDTRKSMLRPIPGYTGDSFPKAAADLLGNVCPHFAHIRKTNPRDIATDMGKPHDTMLRMILRRGIPFGKPLFGVRHPSRALVRQERGLMFICYGATIEDQFELLTRRWANSPIQPNLGGHDPIIGQTDTRGLRERFIDFPTATGPRRIKIATDWVVPTGGGYFFSPPIEAITAVLAA
jgi:Dyp-type peroxidase family